MGQGTREKGTAGPSLELQYDEALKRLLANKRILAAIMKGCVEEYRDCTVEEIAEKYIEGAPQVGEAEELRPSEHRDGMPGEGGRGELRRAAEISGGAAVRQPPSQGEVEDFVGGIRHGDERRFGKRGAGYV